MTERTSFAPAPFETQLDIPDPNTITDYNFDPNANNPTTPFNDSSPIIDNPLLEPYSTLDEPVSETIMRDVRTVSQKLRVVLLPLDRYSQLHPRFYVGIGTTDEEADEIMQEGTNQRQIQNSLREWDLWGPLLITLITSILLSAEATVDQTSTVFASVFVLVWVGAAIVSLNARLLGGSISFFQTLCVFGYCVFPLTLSAFVIAVFRRTPLGMIWLDILWVMVGYVWAIRASTVFIGQFIVKERRALAVFPVLFFYLFLSWMILLI